MTRRTKAIVTMAASLMMSGFALADSGQPGQSSATGGQYGSQTGQQSSQMGQQTDRQIIQQIEQFRQDPNTAADKLFVLHTGIADQFEMQLAQQAQQKVQNDQLKQLSQKIVQDHQQSSQQLQQVAQQLSVQIPQSLPEMKQQEIQLWNALPADQFEKQYVVHLQADHAMDITKFQAVAQLAQNDQVKQFAQKQLPMLQQHYQQAQQAAVALGVPSNGPEAMPASGRIGGSSGTGGSGDMNTRDSSGNK